MKIPIYQVDAFTDRLFAGNPAAVCPLESWLEDALLQNIALENNLAETAFFCPEGDGFHLRWFTPELEMDLCGHATLASAHVLFEHLGHGADEIRFSSASGPLAVSREGQALVLDFPSRPPEPSELPDDLRLGLGGSPTEILKSRDYVVVYGSEAEIHALEPDASRMSKVDLGPGCLVVTAPGDKVDFVSRVFCPGASVFEDPVTGSAHCSLVPYWASRLGKTDLQARQVSPRGGELNCRLEGDRVCLGGKAKTFLVGEIWL